MKTIRDVLCSGEPVELTHIFDDRFEWNIAMNLADFLDQHEVHYNGKQLTKEETRVITQSLKLMA